MRNAMDAQEVAIGWWPGDPNYGEGGVLRLRTPGAGGLRGCDPPALTHRWDDALGEYILDWEDVRKSDDPHATALEFAHSVFRHACAVCEWDMSLLASVEGRPPPVV